MIQRVQQHKSKGFTLIEVCLVIAILGILGVAMSHVFLAGTNSQISYKVGEKQEEMTMRMIDSIRADMRRATTAELQGNTILILNKGLPTQVQYSITNQTMLRNGQAIDNTGEQATKFSCQTSPTFQAIGTPVTEIRMVGLCMQDTGGTGSKLDQNFGKSTFRMANISFSLPAATVCQ